jgi:hypothetical protein
MPLRTKRSSSARLRSMPWHLRSLLELSSARPFGWTNASAWSRERQDCQRNVQPPLRCSDPTPFAPTQPPQCNVKTACTQAGDHDEDSAVMIGCRQYGRRPHRTVHSIARRRPGHEIPEVERKSKQAMNHLQEQRLALAKRLIERLRQETSPLPLFHEERPVLLSALDLLVQEQTRSYTVLIPIRIPTTSRTSPSEKRYVTRFLRRWKQYWQARQAGDAVYELELVQEERDEDAGGVFFELTFSVGRKLTAQEKRWLEEQPGVVTVQYVRDIEEDFPAAPTGEGSDGRRSERAG